MSVDVFSERPQSELSLTQEALVGISSSSGSSETAGKAVDLFWAQPLPAEDTEAGGISDFLPFIHLIKKQLVG